MLGAGAPLIAALAVIALLGFCLRETVASPFFLAFALALVGVPFARFLAVRGEYSAVLRLYVIVFSANTIAAVTLFVLLQARYGVPFLIGGTDDLTFHEAGLMLYQRGALTPATAKTELLGVASYLGYPLMVAWTYAIGDVIGGVHSILPRILNVFLGSLVSLLVYRIARFSGYEFRVALAAAYFTGLYPFIVFHNVLVLRDTAISVLILGALCAYLAFSVSGRGIAKLAVIGVCLGGLFYLRDATAALMTMSLFVVASLESIRRSLMVRVTAVLVAAAFLLLFSDQIAYWYYRATVYQGVYLEVTGGVSAADSLGMALLSLPFPLDVGVRLMLGLLWPLPVLVGDPAEMFKNTGALVWYPLVPFVVAGWIRAFSSNRSRPAAITALLFFLGVALVTLAFRHMTQFVPLLTIFGFAELMRGSDQRLLLLGVGALAAAAALGAYISMKGI